MIPDASAENGGNSARSTRSARNGHLTCKNARVLARVLADVRGTRSTRAEHTRVRVLRVLSAGAGNSQHPHRNALTCANTVLRVLRVLRVLPAPPISEPAPDEWPDELPADWGEWPA